MHIDIYSIILFQLSTILLVYLVAIPINRVNDESIKSELKKLRSDYDGAIGLGDIIIWPLLMTIIFPFYVLLRLIFKRKLIRLIKVVTGDARLAIIMISILLVFLALAIFAVFQWYIAYAVVFIPAVVYLVAVFKREKSRYQS